MIARQIQAQSYLNNQFVTPEGLVVLETGQQVLAHDIADPSEIPSVLSNWTEYSLGVAAGTSSLDPICGELVAWKKRYAPLDALPTYVFCKDHLWPGWEEYLREVDANPYAQLAEPEALGKTINAGQGVIIEFMRNEIQRVYGKNEVWFMGLVEDTVFKLFVRKWGSLAVEQIGDSKQLDHPHVNPEVKLVPTVMNIDKFYLSFFHHLRALSARGQLTQKHLDHFIYMTDGLSDDDLGWKLSKFRARLLKVGNE